MNEKSVYFKPKKSNDLFIEVKSFKSVHDHTLSEKEIVKARVELGETEEKKKECLSRLKEKLIRDGLISSYAEDSYLLRFLRTRKYDVERAYKNVKLYRELKKKVPEMFAIGPDIRSLLDIKFITLLPHADEEGRSIFWMTIKRWKLQETSLDDISKCVCLYIDLSVINPKSQINGVIGLWNSEGLTWDHAMELLRRNRFYNYMKFQENASPYRIHKLILVNCSPVVQMLYRVACRTIISKKIAERVFLLGSDMSELHQHVNPLILPKELGGRLDETECCLTDHVMNNLPYIQHERSFIKI